MRLPTIPKRVLAVARALGALVVCAVGVVVAGRIFDRHYPLENWLIWRLLPIWGYTLLFNAACVSGGAGALGLILRRRRLPALEWLLFSMAVGVVLFVLGLYAAGFACGFRPWFAIVLPVVLLGAGYREAPRLLRALGEWRRALPHLNLPARIAAALALGWGAFSLGLLYLEALDVSSLNFDAAWYHYPIAQDYARTHCIIPFPAEGHRAFPHLTSMLHTWGQLVPGLKPEPLRWMLSLHLEYSLVLWRIVGVLAAALWMLRQSHAPGLWVVFFLFPSLFVYDQNIGGSADHVLGFFAIPMLLATARTWKLFEWRWAVVLGIVAGGHLLTKYQAVYMVVAVALVCFVRWAWLMGLLLAKRKLPRRRRKRLAVRFAVGPAVVIAVAAAVSAPHFLKNVVYYNNPVYPLAQSVFKTSTPKREPGMYTELPQPAAFRPKHTGLRRQLWVAEHLFEYSFQTANRKFTKNRPYMGSLFSLLLPCLLFVARPGRIWLTVGVAVAAFWVWANTAPNDRYLLSFLDLFIAATAALIVRVWQLGWLARLGLVPLVALQLFWGGDAALFYGAQRLRAALALIAAGYEGKTDAKRFDDHTPQRLLTRATPPDAVILARNFKAHFGLNRLVLSDIRSSQSYIDYSRIKDSHELWKLFQSRGVTHLMYPHGDRLPPRWNNTVLFADLFHNHALDVQRFGKLVLGKMPPAAPPPSAPLYVLVQNIRGYRDGLYAVEQLDIDNASARYFKPAPKPITPLAKDNTIELLGKARAVALGTALRGEAATVLHRQFKSIEKWGSQELYLRR